MTVSPSVARPGLRFLVSHPAHLLALGFGSGLSPIAPGTVGTLWAWVAYLVLQTWLAPATLGWIVVASVPVGWWACTVTARRLGVLDPGNIVIDEIVAFWLVLWLLLPAGFLAQLVAFALFRFFDAAKPGPVGWADSLFHGFGWRGGLGIVLDDLVAAFCTLLVIALWRTARMNAAVACAVRATGRGCCAHAAGCMATAESCTGGLIAASCTDLAGSSDWFERGFVTYSNDAKSELLGVDPAAIALAWRGERSGRAGDGVRRAAPLARAGQRGGHGRRRAERRQPRQAGGHGLVRLLRRRPAVAAKCGCFDGDRAAVREAAVRHALERLLALVQAEPL